jgi:hypothetical protein
MPNASVVIYKSQCYCNMYCTKRANAVNAEKPNYRVNESEFDAAMRKLIATPASAKEGIKPTKVHKKSAVRNKARVRRP